MKNHFRLLLVLICFVTFACSKNLSYTFELPKEEIQKKLEEKFPLKPGEKDKEKSPVELTVSNPVVILEDGKNQIGIKVNLVAIPATPAQPPSVLPSDAAKAPPAKPAIKGPSLPSGPGKPPAPPVAKPEIKSPALPANKPALPIVKPQFTGTATVFASISYNPDGKTIHLSNPKITSLDIAQLPEPLNKPIIQMAESTMAEKFAEKPIPLESKTTLDKTVTTFLKSITVKSGKVMVEIGW